MGRSLPGHIEPANDPRSLLFRSTSVAGVILASDSASSHIVSLVFNGLIKYNKNVELEGDLEGLLHISELADHKINTPQDVVNLGDEIEVKILRVDNDSRAWASSVGLTSRGHRTVHI